MGVVQLGVVQLGVVQLPGHNFGVLHQNLNSWKHYIEEIISQCQNLVVFLRFKPSDKALAS